MLRLALLLAVAGLGWGQATAPAAPSTSPHPALSKQDATTVLLYRALFNRVGSDLLQADEAKKSGKDDSKLRHHWKQDIGLTDMEEAALDKISAAYAESFAANFKAVRQAATDFKKHNPTGKGDTKVLQGKLQALQDADDQAVLSSMRQVEVGFGSQRFAVLDRYVRTTLAKSVDLSSVNGTK